MSSKLFIKASLRHIIVSTVFVLLLPKFIIAVNASNSTSRVDKLKEMVGSSEALHSLLQARGIVSSRFPKQTNPAELKSRLDALSPKQMKYGMEPEIIDIFSSFENAIPKPPVYAADSHKSMNSLPSNKYIEITDGETQEEMHSPKSYRNKRRRRKNDGKKYSSKFRLRNKNKSFFKSPVYNYTSESEHIEDPNLRNHRLYKWEYETYKNFTHIDREEDLLADESFMSPSGNENVVSLNSSIVNVVNASGINGGMTDNMETTGPYGGTHITKSSEEQINRKDELDSSIQRDRSPLIKTSTENQIIYNDLNGERRELGQEELADHAVMWEEAERSAKDPKMSATKLSPPVFVDPDEDFFTSSVTQVPRKTIFKTKKFMPALQSSKIDRILPAPSNYYPEVAQEYWPVSSTIEQQPQQYLSFVNSNSQNQPQYVSGKDYYYYPEQSQQYSVSPYQVELQYSDGLSSSPQILGVQGANSNGESEGFLSKVSNFFKSKFSNSPQTAESNNDPLTQVYAPGQESQYYHPFADKGHNVGSSYGHQGWNNTLYALAGLVLITVLLLTLPRIYATVPYGKTEEHYGGGHHGGGHHHHHHGGHHHHHHGGHHGGGGGGGGYYKSDLWDEIKGVYNDVVKVMRGDFSGITGNQKDDNVKVSYYDESYDDEYDDGDQYGKDSKEKRKKKKKKSKSKKGRKGSKGTKGRSDKHKERDEDYYFLSPKDLLNSSSRSVDGSSTARSSHSAQPKKINKRYNILKDENAAKMYTPLSPSYINNTFYPATQAWNATSSETLINATTFSPNLLNQWSQVQLINH